MPEHQQIQQSKKTNTIFQMQATPVVQTPVSNPYSIIQRVKINPKSLTHADIMQLQRTIGNREVGRLLTGIGNTSTAQQATVQRQEISEEEEPLQGKMIETIQRQEIPEEEEPLQGKMVGTAQRQEIPEEEEPLQGKMSETVQRQEIPEEEEPLQGKFENKHEIACPSCFAASIVQRQEIPEEEEPLQGKMAEAVQRQEIPEEEEPLQGKFENKHEIACPSCFAVPIVQKQEIPEEEEPLQGKMSETVQRQEIPEEEEPLQTKRENNTGMPDNLKAGVESLSGIDMSDVRVHYGSDKPAKVGALAYTQGTDIHVASGQERHLPHEAWHVVQQAQGRVKPTMQLKDGIAVNDDIGLEHEADVMGAKSLVNAVQFRGEPEELQRSQSTFAPMERKEPEKRQLQTTKFPELDPVNVTYCQEMINRKTSFLGEKEGAKNTNLTPVTQALMNFPAIQRFAVNLDVGGKTYVANFNNGAQWVTFTKGGGTCWLYIGKCVSYNYDHRKFIASDFIVPHIQSWLRGNLVLYRGLNTNHIVYPAAQRGEAPAKPTATDDFPDFTSETSTTKFIPFTASREVGVMAAKRPPSSRDDQIGVLLRVIIGTEKTIGVFDDGEIQILNPPVAYVIEVYGGTLISNKRIDGGDLDDQAILDHLHERLDDPMWAQLGVGLFGGTKVPNGIAAMRAQLANRDWKAVLNLAMEKEVSEDQNRHPQTKELYSSLSKLRSRAVNANLMD